MRSLLLFLAALLLVSGCAFTRPRAANEHLRQASKLFAEKNDAGAGRELDAAIATAPLSFQTYLDALGVLLKNGRYREAAEYAGFVLESGSGKQYLNRALTTEEQLVMLRVAAEARYRLGDLMAAAAAYEKALTLDPENPTILNNLGYYYAEAGRELPRALALTTKAVALSPNQGIFIDSLGWAYYKLGRYEEAERELLRAVRLVPNEPDIRYHLGVLYARWGDPVKARIELRKALLLAPGHELARAELSRLDPPIPPRTAQNVNTPLPYSS